MGEYGSSSNVPKKFYRYFFKALGYYTDRLNRACTLSELQAYVYLKSNFMLSEKQLVPMSESVMKDLVASGIALGNGGFYRLNEFLRTSENLPSIRQSVKPSISSDSHDNMTMHFGSGPGSSNRGINFSNIVTLWHTDRKLDETATLVASPSPGQLHEDAPQNPVEEVSEYEASEDEPSQDEEKKTKSNDTDPQTEEKKDTADQSDSSESLRVSTSSSDGENEVAPIPHKPIKQEGASGDDEDGENK